jgi:hypothetical protein
MPIKEIDPNDPIFRQLNTEARVLGKLQMSKFAMPTFMQKRETVLVEPKAKPIPVPVPVPLVPEPEPTIEPLIEPIGTPMPVQQPIPEPAPKFQNVSNYPAPEPVKQVRSVDTLPQVKVKVKPSWELPIPTSTRRKPVPPAPIPEPAPQPIPARAPEYVWPKKPSYQPIVVAPNTNDYQQLDSADIYGTKLPSFFQRKVKTDPFFEETVLIETKTKTKVNWKPIGKLVAQVAVGVILVGVGLFSTGTYYTPPSRFTAELAVMFYTYQLGTFLAIVGCIVGYDAFRKAGKL